MIPLDWPPLSALDPADAVTPAQREELETRQAREAADGASIQARWQARLTSRYPDLAPLAAQAALAAAIRDGDADGDAGLRAALGQWVDDRLALAPAERRGLMRAPKPALSNRASDDISSSGAPPGRQLEGMAEDG